MTQTHTPGPWHTGGLNPISAPVIYAADGFAVADATVYHRHHDGQTAANAALIAAAPELLAALQDAWRSLDRLADEPDNDHARQEATRVAMACRAAIAKAEGRS